VRQDNTGKGIFLCLSSLCFFLEHSTAQHSTAQQSKRLKKPPVAGPECVSWKLEQMLSQLRRGEVSVLFFSSVSSTSTRVSLKPTRVVRDSHHPSITPHLTPAASASLLFPVFSHRHQHEHLPLQFQYKIYVHILTLDQPVNGVLDSVSCRFAREKMRGIGFGTVIPSVLNPCPSAFAGAGPRVECLHPCPQEPQL
jgi:hypothetical protein